MNRGDLVRVAKGELPADLVVQNGTLVNVNSAEAYAAGVAIKGDRIAAVGDVDYTIGAGTEVLDARGRYLCPGLIDTHIHVGGSQLTMTEFARAVIPKGTTVISTDFYEIGVVAGVAGIRLFLDEAKKTPLKVLFTIPLHHYLGHGPFGNTSAIRATDLRQMMSWPECLGLSEWNVFLWELPDDEIRDLLAAAWQEKKLVGGHFAQIPTSLVNASAALGIYSEHEAAGAAETLEKIRAGVHIQVRQGSAAFDLAKVVKAITEDSIDARHFSFCSDEQEADGLVLDGHIDLKVRMAIANGVPPLTAVQMASLNAAEYFGVANDLGSIAPGKIADVVLVDELVKFNVMAVIADGKVVGRDGRYIGTLEPASYPKRFFNTVKVGKAADPEDFKVSCPLASSQRALVRVIGIVEGSLVTEAREVYLPVEDGEVLSDPDRDVAKVAVLDRHQGSGRIGKGFVQGLGIRSGAVGSTFNPGLMNLVVAGTDDADMSVVANRIAELGGGYVVARGGEVIGELPLPLLGIFSDQRVEDVVSKLEEINGALREDVGSDVRGLHTALAFICLPVSIPALKICDLGIVDVTKMAVVDLFVE